MGKNFMMYTMHKTTMSLIRAHSDAKLPTQSIDDVGFDIYSVEDVEIPHGSVGKVDTGLQYAEAPHYPEHTSSKLWNLGTTDLRWSVETKIEGRSGLASRFIFPIGGVVDPSYRGNIIVILANLSGDNFKVNKGDKIAQLVLRPVIANTENHTVEFVFKDRDSQKETRRGNKGFGSSGY